MPFSIETKTIDGAISSIQIIESPTFTGNLPWLKSYLTGNPDPLPPLHWPELPPFTRHILETLATIPFGHTITYSELAALAGHPKAARAVGGACHRNPFPLLIPCHRVLAKQGLGGFALGTPLKKLLINFEKNLTLV